MSLRAVDWLVIGLYAAALLAIALKVTRRQETSEGYFRWRLKAIDYDGRAVWFGEGISQRAPAYFTISCRVTIGT